MKKRIKNTVFVNDPVGDMLTRIRNAHMVSSLETHCPASKLRSKLLDVFKKEGYIMGYDEVADSDSKFKKLVIKLKYFNGKPVINKIKRVSVPGRRHYLGKDNLPIICNGLGTAFISTSSGIMTDAEARKKGIGGEFLCYIV